HTPPTPPPYPSESFGGARLALRPFGPPHPPLPLRALGVWAGPPHPPPFRVGLVGGGGRAPPPPPPPPLFTQNNTHPTTH
ncbi:hypothetical protein QLF86_23705, partial [Salmonella enterica subsp. enterica serovar Oslo]